MSDRETTSSAPRDEPPRSDLVRIRLPSGEHEWVTADAFSLISEREFLDSERLRSLRRQRNVALASAVVTALGLGAALVVWWLLDGAPPPSPPPAAAAVPPAVASEEPASRSSSAAAEIEDTVRAWARAWSSQEVETYLGFYSPSFRVPDGLERPAWESLRRQRIETPRRITVAVSDVETTLTGESSAIARFGQAYRAPGYRDWVAKTLELRREAGRWRIVAERSALIEVAGAGGEEDRASE